MQAIRNSLRAALPLALLALACATPRELLEPAEIARPVVERLGADTLRIRWPGAAWPGAVSVFAGLSPDAIPRDEPVGVALSPTFVVEQLDREARPYFLLVPHDGGPEWIVAERRLPLEGPENFRDLGGYRSADGREVRWGRLYRSDDLSDLTRSDVAYLSRLDVKLVCDLRSESEREAKPDRPIRPRTPRTLDLAVDVHGTDPGAMRRSIRTGGITALHLEATMLAAYRAFVTDHAEEFAAMFRRLEQPENLPALVHCTVGKDRTGFASALVLLALGVPRETVLEDYLRTNLYLARFQRTVTRWTPLYSLFRTDAEDLLPLLEARPAYLEASLAAIEEQHGSLDAYLERALGVGPERREALRAQLLR